mgnify:CR=1 FL=1
MDEREDSGVLVPPQIGDLVRVKRDYYIPPTEGARHPIYGVVVNSDLIVNRPTGNWVQTKMFPEVVVYLLKTREVIPLLATGVEIISNCNVRP